LNLIYPVDTLREYLTISTTFTALYLSVDLWSYGGDAHAVVKILPPLFRDVSTTLALILSSITFLGEIVEVVEVFFGSNQVIDR
jgi:hypothetical protein